MDNIYNVKFIRLVTGDDIVASVIEYDNGNIALIQPLLAKITKIEERVVLVFYPWLPIEIVSENQAIIKSKQILAITEPRIKVITRYLTAIERIKEISSKTDIEEFLGGIDEDTMIN